MTQPRICLTTMLKNEGHIIERMMESVKDYITYWVITDTGSTDGTQDIVRQFMAEHGIEGKLFQVEWEDFGANRSLLLEKAREHFDGDYLLLLDADHVLNVPDGSFEDLTADSYLIELEGEMRYYMPYLVSAKKPFRFVGATHEFLTCDDWTSQEKHPLLSIEHYADGGTRPEKYERDKYLLEREYEKDPNNERTLFYLAQTYQDCGDTQAAQFFYRKRIDIGGWYEENFIARLRLAHLTGNTDDFYDAWNFCKHRVEPLYFLIKHYNEKGLHEIGWNLRTLVEKCHLDPSELLFVEQWMSDYGVAFELAIAAWWCGEKEYAKKEFIRLLTLPNLPGHFQDSCINNLKFC